MAICCRIGSTIPLGLPKVTILLWQILPLSGTCQGCTWQIRDQPASAAKRLRDRLTLSSVKPKFDDRLLVNLQFCRSCATEIVLPDI